MTRYLCLVAVFIICGFPIKAAQTPLKKVLVLHSGDSDFYWTIDQMNGIRKSFSGHDQDSYLLTSEYLDLIQYSDETYIDLLEKLLLRKYEPQKKQIVGIIATDDAALDFFVHRLMHVFEHVPLVFTGINGEIPETLKTSGRDYFVLREEVSYRETLDVAFQLHPDTERVIVLSDSRLNSQSQKEEIRKLAPDYPAKFIYRGENESFAETSAFLRTLGAGDIVLRLSYYRDAQGGALTFSESIRFLNQNTSVPIYTLWRGALGTGIVGGKVLSGFHHGRAAGDFLFQMIKDPRRGSRRF